MGMEYGGVMLWKCGSFLAVSFKKQSRSLCATSLYTLCSTPPSHFTTELGSQPDEKLIFGAICGGSTVVEKERPPGPATFRTGLVYARGWGTEEDT